MQRKQRHIKRVSPIPGNSRDEPPAKKIVTKFELKSIDDTSSESDIENYLQSPSEIDLNSSLFSSAMSETSTFKDIEQDILTGIIHLSQSESDDFTEKEQFGVTGHGSSKRTIHQPTLQDQIDKFKNTLTYSEKFEGIKKHIEIYKIKNDCNKSNINIQGMLAVGETKSSFTNRLFVSAKSNEAEVFSDSEKEDWEEINNTDDGNLLSRTGVQIAVDLPAKVCKQKDLMDTVGRRLNRIKKETQVYVHKVHLLCWIAHGNYVNKTLGNDYLMGMALSLLPSQQCYPPKRLNIAYLEDILQWYRKNINITERIIDSGTKLEHLIEKQIIRKEVENYKMYVYIFVCLLRSLGIRCRLLLSLQAEPMRPPIAEFCSLSKPYADTCSDDKKSSTSSVSQKFNLNKMNKKLKIGKTTPSRFKENEAKKIRSDINPRIRRKLQLMSTKHKRSENNVKGEEYKRKHESFLEQFTKSAAVKTVYGIDDLSPTVVRRSPRLSTNKKEANNCAAIQSIQDTTPPSNKSVRSYMHKNNCEAIQSIQDTTPPSNKSVRSYMHKNNSSKMITNTNSKKQKGHISKVLEKTKINVNQLKSNPSEESSTNDSKIVNQNLSGIRLSTDNGLLVPVPEIDSGNYQINNDSYKLESKENIKRNESKSNSSNRCSLNMRLEKSSNATYKEIYMDKVNRYRTISSSTSSKKINLSRERSNMLKIYRNDDSQISSDCEKIGKLELPLEEKLDVRHDIVELVMKNISEGKQLPNRKLVKHKQSGDSDYSLQLVQFRKQPLDTDFKEKTAKIKRRIPVKKEIIEMEKKKHETKQEKEKKGINVWTEVFAEAEEKWITVDVIKGQVHCIKEIYTRATHPVSYILAWDNENYIKDLTKRYCANWNSITRKLRVDNKWWEATLLPYKSPYNQRDREEDEELARQQLEQPLPTTISEYKNHPLYALKRHLLKFEALYPPDASTLGFVKNEPVYSRDCVHVLHSRDIWLKHAKVVKPGEQPYKIVRARPRYDKLCNSIITDQRLEIFGEWQVENYIPPTAENGLVPRNAYGNVELFKPSMLPKGTVHLQLPGLNKIARKLNIDCASAITGFDFHGGWNHPTYEGYIVCEQFSEQLIAAWYQEQEELEKKTREKNEKRIYDNWKRLIRGLLIREKLKAKYDFGKVLPVYSNKMKKRKKPHFKEKDNL